MYTHKHCYTTHPHTHTHTEYVCSVCVYQQLSRWMCDVIDDGVKGPHWRSKAACVYRDLQGFTADQIGAAHHLVEIGTTAAAVHASPVCATNNPSLIPVLMEMTRQCLCSPRQSPRFIYRRAPPPTHTHTNTQY